MIGCNESSHSGVRGVRYRSKMYGLGCYYVTDYYIPLYEYKDSFPVRAHRATVRSAPFPPTPSNTKEIKLMDLHPWHHQASQARCSAGGAEILHGISLSIRYGAWRIGAKSSGLHCPGNEA